MAASNVVKGTPFPAEREQLDRGVASRGTRSRYADADPAAALSKLKRDGFYGAKLATSTMVKDKDGAVHAKKDALPNASLVDWAKAAVWEHGGVGTGAHKVDIPGLPKPPVKSAFEVYVVEMLKQVNRDGDNSSAIRYAVREDASKKWKEMTELDKIKYENTATADKARYNSELEDLKKNNPKLAKQLQQTEQEVIKRQEAARAARKASKVAEKRRNKERKKHDADLRRKAKAATHKASRREAEAYSGSSDEDGSGDDKNTSCVSGSDSDESGSDEDGAVEVRAVARGQGSAASHMRASRRICGMAKENQESDAEASDGEDAPKQAAKKAGGAKKAAEGKKGVDKKPSDKKPSATEKKPSGKKPSATEKKGKADGKKGAKKAGDAATKAEQAGGKKKRSAPAAAEESEEDEEEEGDFCVDEGMFQQVLAEMRSKMTSKDKSKKKIKAPSDQDMLKFAEEIAAAINAGQEAASDEEDEDAAPAAKRSRKSPKPAAQSPATKAVKKSRKAAK